MATDHHHGSIQMNVWALIEGHETARHADRSQTELFTHFNIIRKRARPVTLLV
jgi:hypothetical protein